MKTSTGHRSANAFTLIEVMVATGILVILVLMVGGLFSQASSVWDSGYVRAEGGMVARAIVGSIQRDLQSAVDGRAFDGLGFSEPVKKSSGGIEFVAFSPIDPSRTSKGDRGIRKISYQVSAGNVRRTEELVVSDGFDSSSGRAKWKLADRKASVIYAGSDGTEGATGADAVSTANSSSFTVNDISLEYGDAESSDRRKTFESATGFSDNVAWGKGCPSWCRIRVEILPRGSTSGLEVRSNGGGRGEIVAR